MTVHLYNGSPEVCFTAANFTEERDFDFFKICYFVDGCTFRRLFLGETNSKNVLFCDSCYKLHPLQGTIAVCQAVHHTTYIYVRALTVFRFRVSWLILNLFCEVPLNPRM